MYIVQQAFVSWLMTQVLVTIDKFVFHAKMFVIIDHRHSKFHAASRISYGVRWAIKMKAAVFVGIWTSYMITCNVQYHIRVTYIFHILS